MRRFMELVGENERLRKEVEQGINEANRRFASAQAAMEKSEFETALMLPKQEVSIELSQKNIMSVNVPVFDAKFRSQNPGDVYSYGFAFTPAELDEGVKTLSDIFPKMIRLAEGGKCLLYAGRRDRKHPPQGQRSRAHYDSPIRGNHKIYYNETGRKRAQHHNQIDESQKYDARTGA